MMDSKAQVSAAALFALDPAFFREKPARGPNRTDPGPDRLQKSQRVNAAKQKRKPHPKARRRDDLYRHRLADS